jgi:hypothetical protein
MLKCLERKDSGIANPQWGYYIQTLGIGVTLPLLGSALLPKTSRTNCVFIEEDTVRWVAQKPVSHDPGGLSSHKIFPIANPQEE